MYIYIYIYLKYTFKYYKIGTLLVGTMNVTETSFRSIVVCGERHEIKEAAWMHTAQVCGTRTKEHVPGVLEVKNMFWVFEHGLGARTMLRGPVPTTILKSPPNPKNTKFELRKLYTIQNKINVF